MRVLLTANIVPFMPGGADEHIRGLHRGLIEHGHDVELVRFSFRFSPLSDIENLMEYCQNIDFEAPNGVAIDQVISLQFPAYGVRHPNHRVWVMHQHRAVYDLYDQQAETPEGVHFRNKVREYDCRVLSRARRLFANSRRVAERLKQYNNLKATPLYHPPPRAEDFFSGDSWGYIFCPSRLETLKRQDLLIRAAKLVKSPVQFVIAGDGGQMSQYQRLIDKLGVGDKVHLIGRVTTEEKLSWYAHSHGVFFGPQDEDYGYITLEAMLSGKPVITCSDSGGTLEFVEHNVTGLITEPSPEAVAQAIENLWADPGKASLYGKQGLESWRARNITWASVVQQLLK